MPSPTNGSGDFAALALTDGFVELPPGPAELARAMWHACFAGSLDSMSRTSAQIHPLLRRTQRPEDRLLRIASAARCATCACR